MKNQDTATTRAIPNKGAVRGCLNRLVRLLGGYTRDDLLEAHRVTAKSAGATGDCQDFPSWHYDKFGKHI